MRGIAVTGRAADERAGSGPERSASAQALAIGAAGGGTVALGESAKQGMGAGPSAGRVAAADDASATPSESAEGSDAHAPSPHPEVTLTTSPIDSPHRASSTFGLAFRVTLADSGQTPGLGPAFSAALGLGDRLLAGLDAAYYRANPTDVAVVIHHAPISLWLGFQIGSATTLALGVYTTADVKIVATDAASRTLLGVDAGPTLRLRIPVAADFGFVVRTNAGYRVRRQSYQFDMTRNDDGAFALSAETGVDFRWR